VTLDVEFTGQSEFQDKARLGFEAKTVINRKDFGVNWNLALETGGVLVGEKVTLELDIEAIKVSD
jgi:polyisoprenoid-binding protein YceI